VRTFTIILLPIVTSKRHSELACRSWTATDDATVGVKDVAWRSVHGICAADICELTVGTAWPKPGIDMVKGCCVVVGGGRSKN
jgi:hypothetical protein